ncbi:HD-GYP domain-containing protein [Sphingobium aquiterrae]|uniref:HD-GYP domain-containing protein n=1 Tax=Sphingobium aquiterrae TaxID=2038656 RepID=UPI003018CFC2
MLKRIRTEDVKLGMFLHKLEGSWFLHPFWKSKLLLDSADQLAELKASKVEWVQIDTSKGLDIRVDDPMPAARTLAPAAPAGRREGTFGRARAPGAAAAHWSTTRTAVEPFDPLSKARRSIEAEMAQATGLVRKSTKTMKKVFDAARLGKAVKLATLEPIIDEISCSVQRNPQAFMAVSRLKKTSEYLYLHSLSVCALMISLAHQLRLGPEETQQAGLAGLLMDAGMGHVPQEIWDKGSEMTPEERTVMQGHTRLAREILGMGGELPEAVLDVCLHHHERLDGSGYPDGLAGDQISLFARMAAICDTYDAMTSNRTHRRGEDPSAVLLQIEGAGILFDAEIFAAFQRAVGIYPVGSLVRLRSHRLAVVIDQNPEDVTLPKVRAFYSLHDMAFETTEDIDLSNCFGRDQIIARETPENWGITDWDAMSARLVTGKR